MPQTATIHIDYFSDVLCVWAYTAQIRIDELRRNYGAQVRFSQHFMPLFGCTAQRIGEGWRERGGYAGFGRHVREVCAKFPHLDVHPDLWTGDVPASSASCHLFLKAVQFLQDKGELPREARAEWAGRDVFEETIWRMRLAFFRDARNIATLDCQRAIAAELSLPVEALLAQIHSGEAMAALCRDTELCNEFKVEGSPTYILNEGRQKLYGNVGYKIIEANVQEILRQPDYPASWC